MTDKPKNKGGRPRSYDEDAALDAAVLVFWRHGFEGASMPTLTDAMGMNRPSLYAAFGDKRGLFLRALDRYQAGIGSEPMDAFEAEPEIRSAVRAFLTTSARNNTDPATPPGCLIGCCAVASTIDVPGVRERVAAGLGATRTAVANRFEAEKARGALPADFPCNAKAALLVEVMQGQALRARAGDDCDAIMDDMEARTASILADAD
jgi:AcrR family transcriptional regulator